MDIKHQINHDDKNILFIEREKSDNTAQFPTPPDPCSAAKQLNYEDHHEQEALMPVAETPCHLLTLPAEENAPEAVECVDPAQINGESDLLPKDPVPDYRVSVIKFLCLDRPKDDRTPLISLSKFAWPDAGTVTTGGVGIGERVGEEEREEDPSRCSYGITIPTVEQKARDEIEL